jgi:NADH:ubiquinone oxidoreductase subunit E
VTAAEIRAHIDPMRPEFADQRSLILPALRFAQRDKGYLTLEDLEAVAQATDLTPAYVEGVASFYDRLYLRPVGRWVISVCVTLPCMLRGSDELYGHLCDRLGLGQHGGTTADGLFTLQEAQCLGACDRAPAIQVNAEDMLGPTAPEDADRLVERLAEAPAPDGYVR